MDTHHFDRLVRRMPRSSRRSALAVMPVLAFELWRGGSGPRDVDARCRPKGDNKAVNKKGYFMCVDGETTVVGAVQRCRLLKQGAMSGKCPAAEPPPA